MSEKRSFVEVTTDGPDYLVWRGQLLAELAFARLPELRIHRPPDKGEIVPYDFLVATKAGMCFFVTVRAFSSIRLSIPDVAKVAELRWSADTDWLRHLRASINPTILFLFDADTDHGRYVRVDELPEPPAEGDTTTIRFSRERLVDKAGLESLVAELQHQTTV